LRPFGYSTKGGDRQLLELAHLQGNDYLDDEEAIMND